jgi:hypothetical protein
MSHNTDDEEEHVGFSHIFAPLGSWIKCHKCRRSVLVVYSAEPCERVLSASLTSPPFFLLPQWQPRSPKFHNSSGCGPLFYGTLAVRADWKPFVQEASLL